MKRLRIPYSVAALLEDDTDGLPLEWPRELPSQQAAFVFAMRIRPGEADYRRGERRKLRRTASACRRAIAEIEACRTAFLAFPQGPEDRRFRLLADLERMARYCEEAARGERGRPRDEALSMLIRAEYRDFCREYPGNKGYWRETGLGCWRGRFLEQMEDLLGRLGYPPQSAESLGDAINSALTRV